MFNVYLSKSLKSNKVYIGETSKIVEDRLKEHNQGSNTWTRQHKPFRLIYYESYHCEKDALRREKFLKSGIGNKVVKAIVKEFSNE